MAGSGLPLAFWNSFWRYRHHLADDQARGYRAVLRLCFGTALVILQPDAYARRLHLRIQHGLQAATGDRLDLLLLNIGLAAHILRRGHRFPSLPQEPRP